MTTNESLKRANVDESPLDDAVDECKKVKCDVSLGCSCGGNTSFAQETADVAFVRPRLPKNHKFAMLMSYNGGKYYGMQVYVASFCVCCIKLLFKKEEVLLLEGNVLIFRLQYNYFCSNSGALTIEHELFEAMHKAGLLTADQLASPPTTYSFQRAARTDKGKGAS